MKKCVLAALLALLLVSCDKAQTYAATSQEKTETIVIEEKKVTAEAGCTSVELQKLLDENAEGKYDLTISIPAGTYELTETLYVYPNTTIEADEEAKLVKKTSYGAMLETKLPKNSRGYKANHDITIEGGIWDSTPVMKSTKGTDTFYFRHSNNIVLNNVVLCNVPQGSHLLVLAGVKDVTISNCSFYGYYNWEKASTPVEAIQILWDTVSCDDVAITGCEFYNLSRGIGSKATKGKYHTNVKLESNEFYDLSEKAIHFSNYKKSRISNNTIRNTGGAGIYVENSPKIRILNNKISKPGSYGIYLYKSGGTNANNHSKIGNNTITGRKQKTGKHGIKVSASPYTSIYSNTLENIDGTGILVYKSKNCKVGLGNNTNNTIKNTTEKGIYIYNACDGTKVQYNKITGAKKDGIAAYATNKLVINRNTISAKGDGIYVKKNCTAAKITNNTIKSAGENGIYVSNNCQEIRITGNTIKAYASTLKDGSGIYVSQAGGTSSKNCSYISKNTITGAGKSTKKYGIHIRASRYMKVESNTLTRIPGTAVYVYKTMNCTVNKNTIKTPKKMGIYFDTNCDKGKISSNTIKKPNGTSIRVNKSPKTLVYSNTITVRKGNKGIYVYNSKSSTIKKNTVKGTTEKLAIAISKSKGSEESSNTIDE